MLSGLIYLAILVVGILGAIVGNIVADAWYDLKENGWD